MAIFPSPIVRRDVKVTPRSTNQRYFVRGPLQLESRNTVFDQDFGALMSSGNSLYSNQE